MMAEENKSGDLAPAPVQSPNIGTKASGSYREAAHIDHLQDKASLILKYNLSRQFTVNSSVLSEEEILARQLRSNASRLTSAEEVGGKCHHVGRGRACAIVSSAGSALFNGRA